MNPRKGCNGCLQVPFVIIALPFAQGDALSLFLQAKVRVNTTVCVYVLAALVYCYVGSRDQMR